MQKYRADISEKQADGAAVWYANFGGRRSSLAKVQNCRLVNLEGDMRRSVYVTGEPDTYFSIPAQTRIGPTWVRGYLTTDDDGNFVFHHCYY